MPTVFRERGFRFLFYSNEGFEPGTQLRLIIEILKEKHRLIEVKWDEHFTRRTS